jgi:hypothetical protein
MDENPEGRPTTLAEVFTPWEAAGESRRDCRPHRAESLLLLARCGILAGGLSFPFVFPSFVGLALGGLTRALARHDLDLICRGDMDQDGYRPTANAFAEARTAMIVSALGLLFWLGVCGLILLAVATRKSSS